MGSTCSSCVDGMQGVDNEQRKKQQEFDPAKHGARSIFGPSAQEDFLQKQRAERRKNVKKQKHNKAAHKEAEGEVEGVLFQKTELVGTPEADCKTKSAAAAEGNSAEKTATPEESSATRDPKKRKDVKEVEPQPVRVICVESTPSKPATATAAAAHSRTHSQEAAAHSAAPSSAGPSTSQPNSNVSKPVPKKPKKGLFFIPES